MGRTVRGHHRRFPSKSSRPLGSIRVPIRAASPTLAMRIYATCWEKPLGTHVIGRGSTNGSRSSCPAASQDILELRRRKCNKCGIAEEIAPWLIRPEPIERLPGTVIPDRSIGGEILCSYLAVLFGKRFDTVPHARTST